MAKGRMFLKRISNSRRMPLLKTDGAVLLYSWIIPHLDVNGCFYADPVVVKSDVFKRLARHTAEDVASYLDNLAEHCLILRYEIGGEWYLWYPDFLDKQPKIDPKKEGKPHIPQPPEDLIFSFLKKLQSNYGVTPELLQSYSPTNEVKSSQEKLSHNKSRRGLSFESCKEKLKKEITLDIAHDQKDMALSKMCGLFNNRGWCINRDLCRNVIGFVVKKVKDQQDVAKDKGKNDIRALGPYFSTAVNNWINENSDQISQSVKEVRGAEDTDKEPDVSQMQLFQSEG